MLKTEDGVINITVAKDISDVVFQPSDWSVVNIPSDTAKAKRLAENLYNMPSHRHVSLVLNRHRRKDRIKGLASLSAFDNKSWRFLDNVSVSYGKPSTCSNNGFLPLCEQGFIFYKGDTPDTKNTAWASDGTYQNATNEWVLCPQPIENVYFKQTYYQKFSWDMQLLLMSMCGQREYSRFIYGLAYSSISPVEVRSLYAFCLKYHLTVEVIVSDMHLAEQFLEYAKKSNKKILEEVTKK